MDQAEFLSKRHAMNLMMFEQNLEAGIAVFKANKDKLSPEEIELLETQIAENKKLIDELKNV
jgi:uncharacterized protein (DUF2267 family)